MKRLILISVISLSFTQCFSQTNTFPASGNVGIGTTSPASALDISASSAYGNIPFITLENTSGANSNSFGPGIILNSHVNGSFPFILQQRQDNTSRFSISRFTSPYTDFFDILQNGNILIGKTSQTNTSYKLDVNGNIRANQVTVNATGADYVFEPGYHLPSLDSLSVYLNIHHHLPGIAPAKQMQADGIDLGQNQTNLLRKIEELTLYVIQINHQQEQQKNKIAQLTSENKELTEENKELKSVMSKINGLEARLNSLENNAKK